MRYGWATVQRGVTTATARLLWKRECKCYETAYGLAACPGSTGTTIDLTTM